MAQLCVRHFSTFSTKKMRPYYTCLFLFFNFIVFASVNAQSKGVPVNEPENIIKNVASFLDYWHTSLQLSDDFIALDTNRSVIPKEDFLKKISTGKYLPVRLTSKKNAYFLFKIKDKVDKIIHSLLRDIGNEEFNNYQWEGKPLPIVGFRDLNGILYNQQTIKDKILVINLWFINCTSCVAEMPHLNKLVDQYKNRKDILFLGFALDKEADLKTFLKETEFKYRIISDTSWYLYKALNIRGFPSQVLINKNGTVVKIFSNFNSYERLIKALKKEAANNL